MRATAAVACAVALMVSPVTASRAAAQNPRDSLVGGSRAYDQGNFERAAALLSYGLDPSAGPEDSVWVISLQKLAHALIEIERTPLAGVWLRWALRHHGRLRANDTDFPPAVFTALGDAALFVEHARSDDSLADTKWEWPKDPAPPITLGALRLTTNVDSVVGVDAILGLGGLVSIGAITTGRRRYLPPGTYTVLASGTGIRALRVEREVLPGVVTDLRLRLQAERPAPLYLTANAPFAVVVLDGDTLGFAGRPRANVVMANGKSTSAWGYPLPMGRHHISVRAGGYVPFDTSVVVGPQGKDVRLSVRLREEPGGRP